MSAEQEQTISSYLKHFGPKVRAEVRRRTIELLAELSVKYIQDLPVVVEEGEDPPTWKIFASSPSPRWRAGYPWGFYASLDMATSLCVVTQGVIPSSAGFVAFRTQSGSVEPWDVSPENGEVVMRTIPEYSRLEIISGGKFYQKQWGRCYKPQHLLALCNRWLSEIGLLTASAEEGSRRG